MISFLKNYLELVYQSSKMLNKNKKKECILLDTSVQIENIKSGNTFLTQKIREYKLQDKKPTTLFFVKYEFRTGLLLSCVDFYFLAKLKSNNIADAYSKWSNNFKVRDLKNILIIESVVFRMNQSIPSGDSKKFLRMLEAAILQLENYFEASIRDKHGCFSSDPIVSTSIRNYEDFQKLKDLYVSRKIIPMKDFWENNKQSLEALLSSKSNYDKCGKSGKATLEVLEKIFSEPDQSENYNNNRKLGDSIVAVDCPKSYTLLTTDRIFEVLCGSLGKKHIVLGK